LQAANTVNNLRKAPLGYRLDSTYLKDKLELFETAIDLSCKLKLAEKCCQLIEMIKSRILTAILSIPSESRSEVSDPLKRQLDETNRQLNALEYSKNQEKKSAQQLNKEREVLLNKREDILERIWFSDPHWRSMTEPIPFDLNRVYKALMDNGQSCINLFTTGEKIVAVLIKGAKSTVSELKIPGDIRSRIEKYKNILEQPFSNQEYPQQQPEEIYDISAGLSVNAEHLIPSEMLDQALQSKGLIIIPHGIFHLIPWAGLNFNGRRLFEYCPIGILPNLSCILKLNTDMSNRPRIALIGSPDYPESSGLKKLVGAKEEIKNIQEIYLAHKGIIERPLTGGEATAENFWKLAKHSDAIGAVLHIACHGTFESDEPLSSGLFMDDCEVSASEIALSILRYDEVVLSACNTGQRPIKVKQIELLGDDILGVPGAFLEAGIKSMLVSIPPADDYAVYEFMNIYHKNRSQGKTPLGALQETQKSMLHSSIYPPYF
jgi:CHAT domain-containing protein